MNVCARCYKPLTLDTRHPRINGRTYCTRYCYEAAMQEKGLTRRDPR